MTKTSIPPLYNPSNISFPPELMMRIANRLWPTFWNVRLRRGQFVPHDCKYVFCFYLCNSLPNSKGTIPCILRINRHNVRAEIERYSCHHGLSFHHLHISGRAMVTGVHASRPPHKISEIARHPHLSDAFEGSEVRDAPPSLIL